MKRKRFNKNFSMCKNRYFNLYPIQYKFDIKIGNFGFSYFAKIYYANQLDLYFQVQIINIHLFGRKEFCVFIAHLYEKGGPFKEK